MKQKLFTLLTLLVLCVTGAWADDETLFSMSVKTSVSSEVETDATAAEVGTPTAYVLTSYADFGVDGTSAVFYKTSVQEDAKAKYIAKSSTYWFSIQSGGNKVYYQINLTKALAIGDVISFDVKDTKNGKNIGLLFNKDAGQTSGVGSYVAGTNSGSTSTLSYTIKTGDNLIGQTTIYFTRADGTGTNFNNLTITRPAVGPKTAAFSLSKTTIAAGETAKILVDGEDIFAANFTAGTLWESAGEGPYVTLSSDGIITAVKNTPDGYYCTFNANSKDLEKYNSSAGVRLDFAVATPTCTAPTITVGDFNFENKGYKVTITSTEEGSTLKVSTDGSSYTTQTSPYETYATTTTHYYAKSIKDSYNDSDVADENVENTFDGGKKYIAWVYTSTYNQGDGKPNYAFATDPMVIALQTVYNVVPVDYAQGDTPSADLKNADLIVCSEAMTGDKTMSNGMVALLDGTAPMIGLKMYNYGAGSDATKRWKWGLPANPGSTVYGFTAKNANYKVLDGVTFESDGTIKLATDRFDSNYKNVIQTANFTGANKPADNVILGTLGSDDEKAVMHYSATKKYFGLGLSCDCWEYYTANATTIVKNAAAMLIAGEDLTAANAVAQVTGKITAAGWTTFSSSEKLDLSTISGGTAYYASGVNGTNAVLTPTGDVVVAAVTGLMIKGTPGDDFTIDVTDAAVTFAEENLLEGLPNGGTVAAAGSGYNYVFGWASAHPEAPGFYKVNGTSAVLGSGKAYLHTTAELADPGAQLGLIFDEESDVTGIKNLTPVLSQGEGAVFDLQGRQVAQPAKGLYIVNGKKVVLK